MTPNEEEIVRALEDLLGRGAGAALLESRPCTDTYIEALIDDFNEMLTLAHQPDTEMEVAGKMSDLIRHIQITAAVIATLIPKEIVEVCVRTLQGGLREADLRALHGNPEEWDEENVIRSIKQALSDMSHVLAFRAAFTNKPNREEH